MGIINLNHCMVVQKVTSRLYDIDVVGYDNGVNKLRLFDVETVDESIVKKGIDFDKEDIEKNLTLFLYPDDSDKAGNLLRIYQQYFMVSNAAQLILRELKEKKYDLRRSIFQDIRMNRRYAVNGKSVMDIDMRHMHSLFLIMQ